MKIAQVVTLVSPDGAYGGPLRVAANQIRGLRELGHEARLFASCRGFASSPREILGAPLTAKPARTVVPGVGFAGLFAPELLNVMRREFSEYDIVHVHMARDLVTLPAAWLALHLGLPVIVQTHGMINRSPRALAGPLDSWLTRPILSDARQVLYLTDFERQDLEEVGRGRARLVRLPNGVPIPSIDEEQQHEAEEIEVLFLARLQARKRPQIFVEAALRLIAEFPNAKFSLVGPDEGEGEAVVQQISAAGCNRIMWEGPLEPERTLARMQRASIFVLPSVHEPFPMSVLEAASCGLPCIITETCGLAGPIARWNAGAVVDDSIEGLVSAIRDLLRHEEVRRIKARNARVMVEREFELGGVARTLEGIYLRTIADASSGTGKAT